MHIVHIATEFAPFAKVGGLGDVVQGLSAEQANLGHTVEVFLPQYPWITNKQLSTLNPSSTFFSTWETNKQKNQIYSADIGKAKINLIKPLNISFFDREEIYGYPDDASRFAYFSRACLDYLLEKNSPIDIIQIHDWHAALVAPLYQEIFAKKGLITRAILLTIHNLSYQGICDPKSVYPAGLTEESPSVKMMKQSYFDSHINLLKGGILYADRVITVSPTYAKEIFTDEESRGLKTTLEENKNKIVGILNGVDLNYWNPLTDSHLVQNYSKKDSILQILDAKEVNKRTLQKKFGLSLSKKPLLSSISRLVWQKGPELIKNALERTLEKGGQFILLGSCQEAKLDVDFHELAKSYRDNPDVAIILKYDEPLSHLVYAASDFTVVPSRFEPCGLTQMLALIYGTLPIVRKVGGLADTVRDADDETIPSEKKNGYTFADYSSHALFGALDRAIEDWFSKKEKIRHLIQNGMKEDFSWTHSAKNYLTLEKDLLRL